MASAGDGLNNKEILEQRHRKERKELQSKIQAIKRGVPKGDKKLKKEAQIEIAKLEAELHQRQELEEQEFKLSTESTGLVNEVAAHVDKLCVDDATSDKPQRISKAQRRKNKKAAKDKEREKLIAEGEEANIHGPRNVEAQKLKMILKERGLGIKEIPSDGHCLYNAIQDQLYTQGIEMYTLSKLRQLTSDYMLSNCDDFLPFLINPNTGDLLTHDEYEQYCNNVTHTAAWGGQHEIKALSHVLRRPIEIIQADAPVLTIGEEFSNATTQSLLLS
ncbi:deubiquitinase OTUD6B-like [Saccoglossus kowalevskii]|uniref:OTU domain-containing protein 6B-like n=1 Tax=Saccoglossus kowalevskii TaxID=10224 RepID=A0ABM0LVW5_SACKO|nr:PREDICTED: OTU domain-containing protein 6B-like [Saccoglossus kowalevskii]